MRLTNIVRSDPHVPLALAAVAVLAGEWRQAEAGVKWPLFEAGVFAIAFAFAWRRRERLRLAPLLFLTLLFELASIAIHVHVAAHGDADPIIYGQQGKVLVDGRYPPSEYPAGAVALFGLETWISGGATRTANALTMVPFHLLGIAALWLFRTQWSRWVAAFVAMWPLNLFYWEFRFDLVPATLLTVGLLLAYREQWLWSAVVLSIGALVKWTPGLAALALVVWLVGSRRPRLAGRYVVGFVVPIALTYVPLLAWSPTEVLHAYSAQGGRNITGESLPFLVLRVLGQAKAGAYSPDAASVATWGDNAAIACQALILLMTLFLVARVRDRAAAVALAAMVPVVFLLTNRIFSPQFFVVTVAAWATAMALLPLTSRQVMVLTGLIGAATIGNAVVWPTLDFPLTDEPGWIFASAAGLVLGAAVTIRLGAAAGRRLG
jgi:hypothetical protein